VTGGMLEKFTFQMSLYGARLAALFHSHNLHACAPGRLNKHICYTQRRWRHMCHVLAERNACIRCGLSSSLLVRVVQVRPSASVAEQAAPASPPTASGNVVLDVKDLEVSLAL